MVLNELAEYLAKRGVNIIKRGKPMEITEDAEKLAMVAGAWTTDKEAIKLVIQARCDQIRQNLVLTDLPYETVVSRQALVELGGILEDFERIYDEHKTREANKGGTQQTENGETPKKESTTDG